MLGTVPPSGFRPRSARRDMRLSTIEGASYCVMVGVGQEYFVAFALALGMGEVAAGLVATLPVFVGSTLQLAAPFVIARVGSLRRSMVIFSTLQACSFLPLLVGALVGAMPPALVYLSVAGYSVINLSQGPAWSTWITTLMPREIRPRYFASRSRWIQMGVLIGLVTGGLLLGFDKSGAARSPAAAFAPLFAIAFAVRLASSRLLAVHSEPVRMPGGFRHVGPAELLRRVRRGMDVGVLGYLLLNNLAWQIALPFFTPYVLEHRGFGYAEFMTLTCAVVLGKMLAAPTVGRLAHRYGARRILWIGAIGSLAVAPLWAACASYPALLAVQFAAGPVFVCFDVGAMLVQYDTIPEHERASLFATFTAFNGLAGFVGSAVGGLLLGPVAAEWLGGVGIGGYTLVFCAAALGRLLVLPLLGRIKEVREPSGDAAWTTVRVEPGAGETLAPSVAEDE